MHLFHENVKWFRSNGLLDAWQLVRTAVVIQASRKVIGECLLSIEHFQSVTDFSNAKTFLLQIDSFAPPKQETFFKDDANHDPQWTEEEIISANFVFNGRQIGPNEVDIMRETTIVVFEILEKAWATRNCALIDMKIEFGIDEQGQILLADVIDSDSWRLWPSGDKRLMVDKQVYRNLTTVTDADLQTVKTNFEWIRDQMDNIIPQNDNLVVILMGSPTDTEHCEKIAKHCRQFGLNVELRVTSAHKGTRDTIQIVREYESLFNNLVFIAVAGRSNGLGPVLSGTSS